MCQLSSGKNRGLAKSALQKASNPQRENHKRKKFSVNIHQQCSNTTIPYKNQHKQKHTATTIHESIPNDNICYSYPYLKELRRKSKKNIDQSETKKQHTYRRTGDEKIERKMAFLPIRALKGLWSGKQLVLDSLTELQVLQIYLAYLYWSLARLYIVVRVRRPYKTLLNMRNI